MNTTQAKMTSQVDSSAELDRRNRIWFFPHKFWATTKGMPQDQVSSLMAEVERLAEAGDAQALRKYTFVFVGDPY